MEIDDDLSAVLEQARTAGPSYRIEFRDAIASHGGSAIDPIAEWLRDPTLGPFAARVLGKIGDQGHTRLVLQALELALPFAPSSDVRSDIETQIKDARARIARDDQAKRERIARDDLLAWLRRWRPDLEWDDSRAKDLTERMNTVDSHRAQQGLPPLKGQDREAAARLQLPSQDGQMYKNHCWRCSSGIDSTANAKCPVCPYYICVCGVCLCDRPSYPQRSTY